MKINTNSFPPWTTPSYISYIWNGDFFKNNSPCPAFLAFLKYGTFFGGSAKNHMGFPFVTETCVLKKNDGTEMQQKLDVWRSWCGRNYIYIYYLYMPFKDLIHQIINTINYQKLHISQAFQSWRLLAALSKKNLSTVIMWPLFRSFMHELRLDRNIFASFCPRNYEIVDQWRWPRSHCKSEPEFIQQSQTHRMYGIFTYMLP